MCPQIARFISPGHYRQHVEPRGVGFRESMHREIERYARLFLSFCVLASYVDSYSIRSAVFVGVGPVSRLVSEPVTWKILG